MPLFTARTTLPHPPAVVFEWHERPGAFERLAPPWVKVKVLEHEGGLRDGARLVLRVSKGPLDVRWILEHHDYDPGRGFRVEQVSGPLSSWSHVHRFRPADAGGTVVEDEVQWEPPLGSSAELFTRAAVERQLERLFAYRHRRLANDLALHARFADAPRRTVAISGSSGLIGSALRHFLTSGGHRVLPMVRSRERAAAEGAVYWNGRRDEIDRDGLARADAVVHLAGEPMSGIRWTRAKKEAIRESRVRGTELVARTVAGLHQGPNVLVNASGIGYYGGRGDEMLTEESGPGRGFVAETARAWEEATRRADGAGVRVVRIRSGFVLSPAGGGLGTMLLPFKAGVGGRLGDGRQYMAWIDLDDEIGLIHHALMERDVSGPLNMCAPNPVPNATFTGTLGRVLGRPTVIPLPSLAVKAMFGEMGEELLLKGQRARPAKARATGYDFLFQGLEESLRFQLGRPDAA